MPMRVDEGRYHHAPAQVVSRRVGWGLRLDLRKWAGGKDFSFSDQNGLCNAVGLVHRQDRAVEINRPGHGKRIAPRESLVKDEVNRLVTQARRRKQSGSETRLKKRSKPDLCAWEGALKTVTDFPRDIELLDPVFIEMSDGVRLAAKIWLPKDAVDNPVPAILEYLPYRRTDGTSARDELTHPYFAGHGYACIRACRRGCRHSRD